MVDREQVIFDIERCTCNVPDACRDCSHYGNPKAPIACMEELMADTLALLKEQEAKNILDIADSIEGIEVGKCPRCDRTILNKQNDPTRFCKYCGQKVKWK